MLRKRSNLFLHLNSNPNPEKFPTVWEHRQQQARPLFSNPFQGNCTSNSDEIDLVRLPINGNHSAILDEDKDFGEAGDSTPEDIKTERKNLDVVWGEQPPEWLSLFYDLAWTATFSNLTSSYSFVSSKQTITYVVFFTIALWIWVAQVFYMIDFYTDDWFHMVCIGLQFVVFGALAALTQGLDILTYITHSPGSSTWTDTPSKAKMDPDTYQAIKISGERFPRIAMVVAFSR
ncbi:low temperature requirement protein LtrA [Ceratobasidium sp. AG-Ba]|nr:low temperature requirement protein LtrA [Ceratobasidium sp. AG-Ba]